MSNPKRLLFPAAKAIYLFTGESQPKKGADKQKFWKEILGFSSSEDIRIAILNSTQLIDLQFEGADYIWRSLSSCHHNLRSDGRMPIS